MIALVPGGLAAEVRSELEDRVGATVAPGGLVVEVLGEVLGEVAGGLDADGGDSDGTSVIVDGDGGVE